MNIMTIQYDMTSVPGKNTEDLLANPYDVDISLIIPSIDFSGFSTLYESLISRCSKPDQVEMLIKIDDINDIKRYYELCDSSPFKSKILIYPCFNKRFSLHHFFNDLGSISSGKIIWTLNDDAEIVGGKDWYKSMMSTRGAFKDNVYYIAMPYDNGKGTKQIVPLPAISREWLKMLSKVTRFPNYDRWLHEIAKSINRRIVVDDVVVTMPPGSRVLSKADRKSIFYPTLEKTIKKLRRM